jgi:hypothetical protein
MGVVCKKCQHTEHYFRKTDFKFQCKKCASRMSLRSGTVMENTNLPFQYWMICIELMTLSKKSFSALEMQRMLGHKRYEPIWFMMHKIRRIMSIRDEKYKLKGCIEFDEGFFERVDNVNGVTKSIEAGVMTTCTCAPAFIRSLTNEAVLYAAIPPETPSKTFLPFKTDINISLNYLVLIFFY